MQHLIYQITHVPSGKIYIGMHSTDDPSDGYMGSGTRLRSDIRLYGKSEFSKQILFSFSTEAEMRQKESEIVTPEFCLREDTYNICPDGKGGWGYVNSTKRNLRTGMIHSEESRQKMGAQNVGRVPTEETRRLISQHNGMKHNMEARRKVSLALTGRTLSAETREKLRQAANRQWAKKRNASVV